MKKDVKTRKSAHPEPTINHTNPVHDAHISVSLLRKKGERRAEEKKKEEISESHSGTG